MVVAAGGVGLWYFRPTEGQTHPLVKVPLLDSLIPIAIVSAFAIGVALIIRGFA
jgi:hypothetical protein